MGNRKHWAYSSGERGRNRSRVYIKPGTSKFYLEWYDEDGTRKRELLLGVTDKTTAKQKADEKAVELGKIRPKRYARRSLGYVMQFYLEEVSPTKSDSKAGHDRRAVRAWTEYFSEQGADRQVTRHPSTLDRRDWDGFVAWRRAGHFGKKKRKEQDEDELSPVRNRIIEMDVKAMVAMLGWASGVEEKGVPLLETNPWRSELRRHRGLEIPKELSPRRPVMSDAIREQIIAHSGNWKLELALRLQRETRRRNSSIRQLLWEDIDQVHWEITWRSETDKAGRRSVTPIMDLDVIELLKKAKSRGVGAIPVFPSEHGSRKGLPISRDGFQTLLRGAKNKWIKSVPEAERAALKDRLRGIAFHAEKRAGVRDPVFRRMSPATQEKWSGTNFDTLRTIYDDPTVSDMREEYQAVLMSNRHHEPALEGEERSESG